MLKKDVNTLYNHSFAQTNKLVKENVWKRNETFFFVNHPSMKAPGFPCITTADSNDPGRPCSFPFIPSSYSTNATNCSTLWDLEPWCYTKVTANRRRAEGNMGYWGNCMKKCNGEPFEPSNEHNLAGEDFSYVWDSDIYDLRTWDDGYCHTYNPEGKH